MQDTPTASKMEDTLAERGGRYGSWRLQSQVTQNIKRAMQDTPNWLKLPDYLRESFDQIANKMARVLSGDWSYNDNLHDMVGYARLAEECLNQDLANPGTVALPMLIDPDNPPVDWMIDQLAKRGYNINHPEDGDEVLEVNPNKVRQPAFMNDGVRDALVLGGGGEREDES